MTAIIKSFHTHAQGQNHGWWGDYIHPAHLNNDGDLIPDTAWARSVQNCPSIDDAAHKLDNMCKDLLHFNFED